MFFSRWRALAAFVSLALIGFGIWKFFATRRHTPPAPATVVLLPFENLTGDASLDWTERLVPFSLARQIEGLPGLHVLQMSKASEAAAATPTHEVSGYVENVHGAIQLHYLVLDGRTHRLLGEGVLNGATDWERRLSTLAKRLLATLAVVAEPRRPVFHSDHSAQLLSEALASNDPARYEAAATADPACGACWLGWAESASRTGGRAALQPVMERARRRALLLDAVSLARLDLLDATLKDDAAARVNALRRLSAALPSDTAPLAELSDVLVATRQFSEASAACRRALELEPQSAALWNSLAYALANDGQFAEAEKAAKHYGGLDPRSPNPIDTQGEIAFMAGRFGDAARLLVAAYDKQPAFNSGLALEKAAMARTLNGNRLEAGQALDRYMNDRASRGDPWVRLTRARWQYLFGQTAQANQLLDRIAASPDDPVAPIAASLRALRAVGENDMAMARRAAQQSRMLARTPPQLVFAALAAVAVEPERAASTFTDPGLRLESRALALTLRGDWNTATPVWREALKHSRGGADAHQRELLALCLVSSGHAAEAAPLVGKLWPLMTREQALVYDFLVVPDLFYVRAEVARATGRDSEMHRFYGLYQQYAGDRADRFGRLAKARAEARL